MRLEATPVGEMFTIFELSKALAIQADNKSDMEALAALMRVASVGGLIRIKPDGEVGIDVSLKPAR